MPEKSSLFPLGTLMPSAREGPLNPPAFEHQGVGGVHPIFCDRAHLDLVDTKQVSTPDRTTSPNHTKPRRRPTPEAYLASGAALCDAEATVAVGGPLTGARLTLARDAGCRVWIAPETQIALAASPDSPGALMPAPGMSLRLVGGDGNILAGEGEGELELRGPNLAPSYLDDEAANRNGFTGDRWWRTGGAGADRRRRDGRTARQGMTGARRGGMSYAIPVIEPATVGVAGSDLRFPVRRIYTIGRNYAAHARETGMKNNRLA